MRISEQEPKKYPFHLFLGKKFGNILFDTTGEESEFYRMYLFYLG
jgi:hypothetical protein